MTDTPWYRPVPVEPDLAGDLTTAWVARTESAHALVPDGCVDVLWVGNGCGDAWLCGPETSGWTFVLPPGTEAVGVRFHPGRAGSALGFDTAEVRDQRIRLDDLLGTRTHRELVTQVGEAGGSDARLGVLQSYVRRWLESGRPPDDVAGTVVHELRRDIRTSVPDLAEAAGLSERQLHRRCTTAFGYGPAVLRRILRLQRFLRLAVHPAAPRDLAGLANAAGYADQQHLARDCREIGRGTPTELLRR